MPTLADQMGFVVDEREDLVSGFWCRGLFRKVIVSRRGCAIRVTGNRRPGLKKIEANVSRMTDKACNPSSQSGSVTDKIPEVNWSNRLPRW
jgi:hypothetical protein